VTGTLGSTVSGALENLTANVEAAGVDIGVGTEQVAGTGGTAAYDIPLNLNIGGVEDGEQVVVTVTDIEYSGLIQISFTTRVVVLTCDEQGNGDIVCT
jgi:hypothetical protein